MSTPIFLSGWLDLLSLPSLWYVDGGYGRRVGELEDLTSHQKVDLTSLEI
jgi:hypothetical protein